MKVGIVVPYSWSFWGGVVEHAELQAEALRSLGHEVKTIMGNDPPGQFTRVLHPRHGRHGMPPPDVIPIGRSVIVPANGTLPNIILSPRSFFRIRQALEREQFDVVHLHEPMTPTPCVATLAVCTAPMVGTFHANGDLGWMTLREAGVGLPRRPARPPHRRLRARARVGASAGCPATTRSSRTACSSRRTPIPPDARTASSSPAATRTARACTSCCRRGRRSAGAPARRCASAAPTRSRVRLLMTRLRVPDDGIDVLGFLPQEQFTEELLAAKALVAPSLGGESFGIVLTRALACATPVVASDIPGYRDVMTPETGLAFPPGDVAALADAVESLLADEPRRQAMGTAGRRLAQERYAWDAIARAARRDLRVASIA